MRVHSQGLISRAGSTYELLSLSAAHSAILNHIHVANLWNKLGKQSDTSGPRHWEEVRRLLRRTVELVDSCESRSLSNIAHGLAKCKLVRSEEADALFAAVAEAAVRDGLRGFNPQALSNTAWAFATAGVSAMPLFAAVAEAAVRDGLRGFKPQELSNTAWAFATAGVPAEALFTAVAEAAVRDGLRGFNPQNLSNTAWAFATAGVPAEALFKAVAEAAVRDGLSGFKPQALSNTAWAFATAGVPAEALFAELTQCITHSLTESSASWSAVALVQLHQWQLLLSFEANSRVSLLPQVLRERCCRAMQATEAHPSRLQSAVASALAAFHPELEEEIIEPQTGYSLDVALRSSRVAIEVDDPSHFLRRNSGEYWPNGPTLLKRRLLKAAGWRVVSVPFYEWDALGGRREEEQAYLRSKLS